MILLTFRKRGTRLSYHRLGIKTPFGIVDAAAANAEFNQPGLPVSPGGFFAQGLAALPGMIELADRASAAAQQSAEKQRPSWLLAEDEVELGPCLPSPGKIICVGLNYLQHAKESKNEIPPVPVLFSKFQNAVAAPGEDIPLVPGATRYDYEAELAVVIGRRAKHVPEDQALQYVLGYCNANDVSARELQSMTSQWLLGKSLDKFLPLGPYLLTADEVPDPQSWPVRCWLNGELRQNSNTSDMIFSVAHIIHFASQYLTLEPGDLISTGTPEGVILGKEKRVWMKAGDSMTVEVGPLGKLTNRLVQE